MQITKVTFNDERDATISFLKEIGSLIQDSKVWKIDYHLVGKKLAIKVLKTNGQRFSRNVVLLPSDKYFRNRHYQDFWVLTYSSFVKRDFFRLLFCVSERTIGLDFADLRKNKELYTR